MDDNKKTTHRDGGNFNKQNRGHGNKNNWHKNKKGSHQKTDRADSFVKDRATPNAPAENERRKKPFRNSEGTNGGSTSNGAGRDRRNKRGGKNGRPQIHDGFDDIRMNPHYVVFDRTENDDDDDYRTGYVADENPSNEVTVGRNAVRELLRSGRSVDKIYVKSGNREGSVVVIVAEAVSRGIPIVEVDQNKLDRIAGGENHQGVVALAAGKEYCAVEDILEIARSRGEKPFIVVSDGIEDPHNLGALIRCAECAGAHGIIIPKRRAVGITPVVAKCSAGAVEHMAVARVTNLASTLAELKKAGIWIFAAEAGGEAYYDTDFDIPAAIVFGSEGDGVSRLVKDRSDFIVSIPMYGRVNSLNVSTAASVVLCHASRVRHGKA